MIRRLPPSPSSAEVMQSRKKKERKTLSSFPGSPTPSLPPPIFSECAPHSSFSLSLHSLPNGRERGRSPMKKRKGETTKRSAHATKKGVGREGRIKKKLAMKSSSSSSPPPFVMLHSAVLCTSTRKNGCIAVNRCGGGAGGGGDDDEGGGERPCSLMKEGSTTNYPQVFFLSPPFFSVETPCAGKVVVVVTLSLS